MTDCSGIIKKKITDRLGNFLMRSLSVVHFLRAYAKSIIFSQKSSVFSLLLFFSFSVIQHISC